MKLIMLSLMVLMIVSGCGMKKSFTQPEGENSSISGSVTPKDSKAKIIAWKAGEKMGECLINPKDGSYRINNLPKGIYNLEVSAEGYFTNINHKNILLCENEQLIENIKLTSKNDKYSKDEIVVCFKNNVSEEKINSVIQNTNCKILKKMSDGCYILLIPYQKEVEEIIKYYVNLPEVRYANFHYINLILTVETDKLIYNPRETINITLFLTNKSREDIILHYADAQMYDVIIVNENGSVIWQWSHGTVYAQMLHTIMIKHGETIVYGRIKWDQKDNNNDFVEKGKYLIKGIMISLSRFLKESEMVKIEIE